MNPRLLNRVCLIFAMSLVTWIGVPLAATPTAIAQIQLLDPGRRVDVAFSLDERGQLLRNFYVLDGPHFLPEAELLRASGFAKEYLGVSEDKEKEINLWLERLDQDTEKNLDYESYVRQDLEEQNRRYRAWMKKHSEELRALLTDQQWQQLRRTYQRQVVYLMGLERLVLTPQFIDLLRIKQDQVSKVFDLVQAIAHERTRESHDIYLDLLRQVEEALSDEQKELYRSTYKEYLESLRPDPELLDAQFQLSLEGESWFDGVEDPHGIAWLNAPTFFILDVSGMLVPQPRNREVEDKYLQLFQDRAMVAKLELSDEQSQELVKVLTDHQKALDATGSEMNEKIAARKQAHPELNFDILNKEFDDLYAEKYQKQERLKQQIIPNINKILVPRQHELLEIVQVHYEVRSFGVINCLARGKLGECLGIKKSQIAGLDKLKQVQQKRLRAMLDQEDREIWTRFEQALNEEQVNALREFLSSDHAFFKSSPNLLFTESQGGF